VQKTAFRQRSPLPAAAVSYRAVRYSKQQEGDEQMIYVHNSVRSVSVCAGFIYRKICPFKIERKSSQPPI